MNAPHKTPSQNAVRRHRERLSEAGLARFEVKAPVEDKDLMRRVARALTESDRADVIRRNLDEAISPAKTPVKTKGKILEAFLSSPLVGADIEFPREPMPLRKVDL